ncbi:MAG TPA: integrase family protein [Methylotenera sp.]
MVKKNFTIGLISALECAPGKKQSIYWDGKTPGLGLRVTATGTKSYIFETSLNNKTIRMTIGDVRTWSISQAQSEATRLKAMTDQSIDPRQVRADKEAAISAAVQAKKAADAELILQSQKEAVTLSKVWFEYIAERKSAKEGKDHSWSARHYNDHLKLIHAGGEKRKRSDKLTEAAPLASLAHMRLVDLTPEVVTDWANTEAEKRPTQARLAFRLLRAFLSWCETHKIYGQIVKGNAAKNEIARKRLGKPQTKNDVLQREQLPAWFTAVKQINNPVISGYLQTLLLTGRRREQVARLKWTDIDFQWKKISMEDKTEKNTSIPLTPYVEGLLQSLPRRNRYVFSSPTAKSGYLADPSDAHRKACAEAGVELTLHGLRRSFATLCEWIETPAGIAAQIQGHAPQGVREQNYIRRPLDLLRMWHIKIEEWMLQQAGIKFIPKEAGLHVAKSAKYL